MEKDSKATIMRRVGKLRGEKEEIMWFKRAERGHGRSLSLIQ